MSTVLRMARTAVEVARAFGGKWVVLRASYEFRRRSGLLKRQLPAVPWAAIPLASWMTDPALGEPKAYAAWRRTNAPRFFFRPDDRVGSAPDFAKWDREMGSPVVQADQIVRGTFQYFSHLDVELGVTPNWHLNLLTGEEVPSDCHWTEMSDFGYGDIKVIWEPSRFGWAYDLVRAYWRTGDERYPERFWQLLESWREANPPNFGPNWKCGQETSLRVMAWCFALYGFADAKATTPECVSALAQMIAFSGQRVEANLGYALSQRNNHGISEGMGLWTIGVLFPELRDAERWREKGHDVLERLGRELIYSDGAFSQQSTNYHRVMLQDYLWSLRLGDLTGQPLSDELRARFRRAVDLLYQLQDVDSGKVPNYGANDGALILPLTSCKYEDYRPVVQACRYLTTGVRTYTDGPWDEEVWWLFGANALLGSPVDTPEHRSLSTSSGYLTLRSETGFAFTRVPEVFRDRPSHADVTHVDIWWRGINVATDAGTYSYNAPGLWSNGLARTAVHNTVTVDDADQMDRVGRFLWAPWLRASVEAEVRSPEGFFDGFLVQHDGYLRLDDPVRHHRAIVRLGHEHWFVVDWLRGTERHRYRLHWLLEDYPCEPFQEMTGTCAGIVMSTPLGPYGVVCGALDEEVVTIVERSVPESTSGWRSTHYLRRTPTVSMSTEVVSDVAVFWSVLGPGAHIARVCTKTLQLELAACTVSCMFTQTWGAVRLEMSSHASERDVLEWTCSL